jgi:sigma-B regulation protein RsbU (phosphoserine phosphatase)
MEAAIPAVMFSGVLDSQMQTGGELGAIFSRLNDVLREKLTHRTHVTLAMVELDVRSGGLRFANAGCPYPCHWRQETHDVVELSLDAYPLGVRAHTVYRAMESRMAPGDYLVLYSDGIAEAAGAAGELFGFERTVATVREACGQGLPPEGVIDHLVAAVRDFSGEAAQGDDITCVVVRMEG